MRQDSAGWTDDKDSAGPSTPLDGDGGAALCAFYNLGWRPLPETVGPYSLGCVDSRQGESGQAGNLHPFAGSVSCLVMKKARR